MFVFWLQVARMEKPDSRNPFAGLGGAGNNPTIRLLESKVRMSTC
jgi:hypothetical protein